jgi:hypothetical protein
VHVLCVCVCCRDIETARKSINRVQGSGFRVQGSGFRVQGSVFSVQGLETPKRTRTGSGRERRRQGVRFTVSGFGERTAHETLSMPKENKERKTKKSRCRSNPATVRLKADRYYSTSNLPFANLFQVKRKKKKCKNT